MNSSSSFNSFSLEEKKSSQKPAESEDSLVRVEESLKRSNASFARAEESLAKVQAQAEMVDYVWNLRLKIGDVKQHLMNNRESVRMYWKTFDKGAAYDLTPPADESDIEQHMRTIITQDVYGCMFSGDIQKVASVELRSSLKAFVETVAFRIYLGVRNRYRRLERDVHGSLTDQLSQLGL